MICSDLFQENILIPFRRMSNEQTGKKLKYKSDEIRKGKTASWLFSSGLAQADFPAV